MQTNEKDNAIQILEKVKSQGYEEGFRKGMQTAYDMVIAFCRDRINCMREADEAEKTEQVSLLDRLAAEYDRKHHNGLKFTYSLDGEVQQTEQEVEDAGSKTD